MLSRLAVARIVRDVVRPPVRQALDYLGADIRRGNPHDVQPQGLSQIVDLVQAKAVAERTDRIKAHDVHRNPVWKPVVDRGEHALTAGHREIDHLASP